MYLQVLISTKVKGRGRGMKKFIPIIILAGAMLLNGCSSEDGSESETDSEETGQEQLVTTNYDI